MQELCSAEQFETFLAAHACCKYHPVREDSYGGLFPAWAATCSRFASADQPDPGGLLHGLLNTLFSYLLALQKQELNPI